VDARALFDVLDLRNITLVVQDWGRSSVSDWPRSIRIASA
jgi:hypothetical protein